LTPDADADGAVTREGPDLSRSLARGLLALWAREGKWAEIPLAGASMAPLIPDGSTLTVRFGRQGLSPGDVVLYNSEQHLVAHRVLRLGRGGRRWGHLKVKGDPLRYGEAVWIPVEDVVGRVIAARRPDGTGILLNGAAGRAANRLAAALGGVAAPLEGRLRSLAGGRRRSLRAVPALLGFLDPIYRWGGRGRGREAGLLLGAEERFLIAAARVRLTEQDEVRVSRLLRGEILWERVVSASSGLGLAPLLYRNLGRRAFRTLVPPAAMATLARGAHAAACRMAIQLESLREILASLDRRGIDPVLLKGAALALTVYDQPALRPMQDIDLLVRAEEVDPAMTALEELGFRGIRGKLSNTFYASHHHARPMIRPGDQVIVEVHRGLVPPEDGLRMDPAEALQRSVQAEALGRSLRVLSPEDQVLHLALHLSYADRFIGRLRDLMDLHALLDAPESGLQWGLILEAATAHEVSRSLFSTFDLARRLLGTRIPEGLTAELSRGGRWDPVARHLLRTLARASRFRSAAHEALIKRARWGGRVRDLMELMSSAEQGAV
jgi:hypothetical protein